MGLNNRKIKIIHPPRVTENKVSSTYESKIHYAYTVRECYFNHNHSEIDSFIHRTYIVPVGMKWVVDELEIKWDVRQCVAVFHSAHQVRPGNNKEKSAYVQNMKIIFH